MEYLKYYIFILSTIISITSAMDAFSSMVTLRNMKNDQKTMVENMEKYLQSEYDRLGDIRRSLDNLKLNIGVGHEEESTTFSHILTRSLEYLKLNLRLGHEEEPGYIDDVDHPIAAYALVRDWASITSKAKYRDNVYEEMFQNQFPDHTDHIGSLRSLLRLQRVYNLSTADMARSNFWGHKSHSILQNNDFFDLGVEAVAKTMYETAIEWMELAVQNPPTHVTTAEFYYRLAEAYYFDGQYEQALAYSQTAEEFAPGNYTVRAKSEFYKQLSDSYKNQPFPKFHWQTPEWKDNYEKLCRNEELDGGSRWYHANVSCEYKEGILPYIRYKVEILNYDPFICMFYDIISDEESDMLKARAKPQLLRAAVGDPAKAYATEERVSKVAWLWDQIDEGKRVTYLSKKVQGVTGLSTVYAEYFSDAEPFQVVNYGMGGQYEPHVDVYEELEHLANVPSFILHTGDRIATFMFYLSDVIEGGATVFPMAKVYVPPVKNAAAFWYNIHRNGELDLRTQHAGCPVLVGEKWVANKWIRERGQIWRRPCGLHVNATEVEARTVSRTKNSL